MEQEEHSVYNGRWWSVGDGAHAGTHRRTLTRIMHTREPLLTLPCISEKYRMKDVVSARTRTGAYAGTGYGEDII